MRNKTNIHNTWHNICYPKTFQNESKTRVGMVPTSFMIVDKVYLLEQYNDHFWWPFLLETIETVKSTLWKDLQNTFEKYLLSLEILQLDC